MVSIEKAAEEIYSKILNVYQSGFEMFDENNKSTTDPTSARTFSFPFIKGDSFTSVTINISDGTKNEDNKKREVKLVYQEDINKRMTDRQQERWKNFRLGIKKIAVRNVFSYKDQNVSKPPYTPRDDVPRQQTMRSIDSVLQNTMLESMTGTSRSSYQHLGPVRIIARHKSIINPELHNARSRNIEKLFIENSNGERFLCPEGTSLSGARAYARHVKNGGILYDDFGKHIANMITEMNQLRFFVRNMRGKVFEDSETQTMVESAINYYGNLHRTLHSLKGQRGYQQYKSLWQPEVTEEINPDLGMLKEKFSRKVFDERLTVALPLVDREFKKAKKLQELTEFEGWANDVTEHIEFPQPSNNPVDRENRKDIYKPNEIEEDDQSVLDTDTIDPKIESILNDNEFNYNIQDGIIYFDSQEEVERAKDFIAEKEPGRKPPEMGVRNYNYGIYGNSTQERELNNNPPLEESNGLSFIKRLAGLTK